MKKALACAVVAATVSGTSVPLVADIMWSHGTDIDQTQGYLRINRILEDSEGDEKIDGYEIDGRYGLGENWSVTARHTFGEGRAIDNGIRTDMDLTITSIGTSYGRVLSEGWFVAAKAEYVYRDSDWSEPGMSGGSIARSYRLTPQARYDVNDFLQVRVLIEFEKVESEDVGAEAAIFTAFQLTDSLVLDVKWGKGIMNTDHSTEDGKWSNDRWYKEPRLVYSLTDNHVLEAAYRDKPEGGNIIDFGCQYRL